MANPDLIKNIIENAPFARKILPRFLGKDDVNARGMLQCKLLAFERGYQSKPSWYDAQKQGAVRIDGNQAYFLAISPKCNPYDYLVHRGAIRNGSDNLENLKRLGVFGNPDPESPTYLQTPGECIARNGNPSEEESITLFVDIQRLLRQRSLFIDPETIDGSAPEARMWNSYFVLGGIPARAITSFRTREPLEDREITLSQKQ